MSSIVVDYQLRGRWLVLIGSPDETFEEIVAALHAHWPGEVGAVMSRDAAQPAPLTEKQP